MALRLSVNFYGESHLSGHRDFRKPFEDAFKRCKEQRKQMFHIGTVWGEGGLRFQHQRRIFPMLSDMAEGEVRDGQVGVTGKVIILLLGSNDQRALNAIHDNAEKTERIRQVAVHIDWLLRRITAIPNIAKVILVPTVIDQKQSCQEFLRTVKQVAKVYEAHVMMRTRLREKYGDFIGDGVHLSTSGYAKLAKKIVNHLINLKM